MANKFVYDWQLVRVKAKSIKDVDKKVDFVLDFLDSNPTNNNYDRVKNWLSMTKLAYDNKKPFDDALTYIATKKYTDKSDDLDLDDKPIENLKLILKDLKKRKYGFQFNKIPKDHIDFVNKLEKAIG